MQVAGELGPDPILAGTVLPIAPAKSYSLEVASSGLPFLSDDLRTDPRIAPPGPLLARGVVSGLAVPILGSRGVLGVLALHSAVPARYGPDDVADAAALAGVVSTAWEQAEHVELLNHQAMHDPLTGLANRALFFDRLHRALDRRPPGPGDPPAAGTVAVMLVDVDDFKSVNDTHGHAAGDELLVTAAHRLSEAVRPQDTVARLGGDEYRAAVRAAARRPHSSRARPPGAGRLRAAAQAARPAGPRHRQRRHGAGAPGPARTGRGHPCPRRRRALPSQRTHQGRAARLRGRPSSRRRCPRRLGRAAPGRPATRPGPARPE